MKLLNRSVVANTMLFQYGFQFYRRLLRHREVIKECCQMLQISTKRFDIYNLKYNANIRSWTNNPSKYFTASIRQTSPNYKHFSCHASGAMYYSAERLWLWPWLATAAPIIRRWWPYWDNEVFGYNQCWKWHLC